MLWGVPPCRLELHSSAPEADALSTELWGREKNFITAKKKADETNHQPEIKREAVLHLNQIMLLLGVRGLQVQHEVFQQWQYFRLHRHVFQFDLFYEQVLQVNDKTWK